MDNSKDKIYSITVDENKVDILQVKNIFDLIGGHNANLQNTKQYSISFENSDDVVKSYDIINLIGGSGKLLKQYKISFNEDNDNINNTDIMELLNNKSGDKLKGYKCNMFNNKHD